MCRTIPIAILICLLIAACSNDARRDPASPEILPQWPMVTGYESPHRTILGLWTVAINDDHSAAEVVPIRTAELHLNTVRLLEVTPCTSCLTIGNIIPVGPNTIDVDVTLRHPFPDLVRYTGFDVRGIFISKADYAFPTSGRSIAWGADVPRLLNYDGYTHLFNPTEFPEGQPGPPALHYIRGKFSTGGDLTSTLNPFVVYRKDAPRRMFEAGSSETKTFRIQAPAGPIWFGYAVDASWQLAEDVVDPVNDFALSANCLEPYEIIVNAGTGMMPDEGGMTGVEVRAYDHQGHQTVRSASVYAPQLFDGEVSLQMSANNGEPYALFGGVIRNERGVVEGKYPLLVRVTDEGDDPNLGPVDAWQVFVLEVGPCRGWATTWGDAGDTYYPDVVHDIEVDRSGNLIVPIWTVSSPDGYSGLCKLDSEGGFLWNFEYSISSNSSDLASDAACNIYLAGCFRGNRDFNPGPDEDFHDAGPGAAGCLTKFDSNGNYLWTRTWSGDASDAGVYCYEADVDSRGNIFLSGEFHGHIDFDSGPGEYWLQSYPDSELRDAFFTAFTEDGTWIRATAWGGPGWDDCPHFAVDEVDSLYLTGGFSDTVDFDPGPSEDSRTSCGSRDCFMTKYDSSGNYQWVRTWGSESDLELQPLITTGSTAGIYVLGNLYGETDLDPGPGEDIHSPDDGGMYLSLFTPDGTYQWAVCWGSESRGVMAMDSGEIYAVGMIYHRESADVIPGPEVEWHSCSTDETIMYLNKISSSGDSIWHRVWEQPESEYCPLSIGVDLQGAAFISGFFFGTCDFDPGLGSDYHEPSDETDAFVLKMPPDGYW